MSIETEIKNLVSAVSVLTNVLTSVLPEKAAAEKPAVEKAAAEKPAVEKAAAEKPAVEKLGPVTKKSKKVKPKEDLPGEPLEEDEGPEVEEVTLPELRKILVAFREKDGAQAVKDLLTGMGYKALGAIPTSEYAAVAKAIKERK